MAKEVEPQKITTGGLDANYTVMDENIIIQNSANVFVHIKQGDNPTDITLQTNFEVDDVVLPDKTIAGVSDEFIGTFSPKIYEDRQGQITIESTETDAEIAVLRA